MTQIVDNMGLSRFAIGGAHAYGQYDDAAFHARHLEELFYESIRGTIPGSLSVALLSQLLFDSQEPSDSTLSDFLVENQGKRCVVVLDVCDPHAPVTHMSESVLIVCIRRLRRPKTRNI